MDGVMKYTHIIEECMMDIVILLNQKFGSAYSNELSANQQLVLTLIDQHGKLTIRAIAERINVSTSAVSQMISKMEQMNLVRRQECHEDRRVVYIHLMQEGKQLIANMKKTRQEIIINYLAKMPTNDLHMLSDKIKKLRDIIRIEGEKQNDEIK